MKSKILTRTSILVSVQPRFVVVDGPNIHTDRVCNKHDVRQCRKCLIESKWKMNDEKFWDRTLDIHRLKEVSEYIRRRGYAPRIFILDGTFQYLMRNRKRFPEVKTKLKLLQKLMEKKSIIILDREKWKSDDGRVVDDIWWISFALEIDALIMTNDQLRDWKLRRDDLPWDEIQRKTIRFSFIPEEAKIGAEQVFNAAELPRLSEMPPEEKIEMKKLEKAKLVEKLSEITEEIQEEEMKIQRDIEDLTITAASEMEVGHDFRGYEDQIVAAWLAEIDREGGTFGGLTHTIWFNVAGSVLGLEYDDHLKLIQNEQFDLRKAKNALGYSEDESHIRILENQMILLEVHTGMALKFSPDQSSVRFLDHYKWEEKKKQMEEEE